MFVGGQNLFNAAKEAFRVSLSKFNIKCLAEAICRHQNWNLVRVHFYTGIPDARDDAPQEFILDR